VPNFGRIERIDPRVDLIIPRDVVVERVADGFKWVEGPVWVSREAANARTRMWGQDFFAEQDSAAKKSREAANARTRMWRQDFFAEQDSGAKKSPEAANATPRKAGKTQQGYLLFSDIPANTIYRWREGEGVSVYLKPSGYTGTTPFGGKEPGSNALLLDEQGRLVFCAHGDRGIVRIETDGRRTTLVSYYQGKRLNSPNDAVFKSNGDLYFTDPPFGLPKTFDDPGRQLPYNGVFRLSRDGMLTLLSSEIGAPNGIAFSPNEKTLYLTDSDPKRKAWLAYDVRPDGLIENGRVLIDASPFGESRPGSPDGLKVDRDGNIFSAGPGGVYVFDVQGIQLGFIDLGGRTSNVAWGDQGSTLYITADRAVYRIRLLVHSALSRAP
jgi:gluconolactonase